MAAAVAEPVGAAVRPVLAPAADQPRLAAMLAAYIAEMEPIIGEGAGPDYPYFAHYWSEPQHRWPYWLRVGGVDAGFALVRCDRLIPRFEIAEFYVAPAWRRQGVGLRAARAVIGERTGRWRITQREANTVGIAFWHRVLDGFVRYEETTTSTDRVRREQRFQIPA